jgi:hypothetical protein
MDRERRDRRVSWSARGRRLGWRVRDVAAAFARCRAKGDTIAMEPRPFRENHYGFIDDPNGVRIESSSGRRWTIYPARSHVSGLSSDAKSG